MPSWPKVQRAGIVRRHTALREYLESFAAITVLTVAAFFAPINYRTLGQVYLLCLVALSLRVGRGPVLAAAILSALAWDFFLIPPRYTLRIQDAGDVALLCSYVVVALVTGQLAEQIRVQGEVLGMAREREKALTESDLMHRALFESVSHELKTPLAVLRSAAWMLRKDAKGGDAVVIREIFDATNRLDRLVANLLDQTRLESGTLAPRLDWCDARDLIQEARREVEPALSGRSLAVEIADDVPLLRVDASLMERAIANLLLNAVTHTPASTAIIVRCGVAAGRIFISVADNGPGIPEDLHNHLFGKFQRGASAQAGGLGLGLSIVRGFVTAQGGDVSFANQPAGGAIFTIRMPIAASGYVPNN